MKNVFIDTNVLLHFYSFTSEHLNKLENIIELIKNNKIKLYLTQQIIDEFNRNRERNLFDTLEYIKNNLCR